MSDSAMEEKTVSIKVELAGGLDILFANCPKLDVAITATGERSAELDAAGQSRPSISVATLITHLSEKMMKDSRKDLFVVDGHIRPGIMVLINEVDWELEGEEECELVDGDEVLFVSTLHGG